MTKKERDMRFILKMVLKVAVLPIIVVLTLMNWLIKGVARIYSVVLAVAYQIFAIGAVMMIVKHQWISFWIILGLFVFGLVVMFGAGTIMAVVDNFKCKLKSVLWV